MMKTVISKIEIMLFLQNKFSKKFNKNNKYTMIVCAYPISNCKEQTTYAILVKKLLELILLI